MPVEKAGFEVCCQALFFKYSGLLSLNQLVEFIICLRGYSDKGPCIELHKYPANAKALMFFGGRKE